MNGLGLTVYLFESVQVSFCLIYRFSSSNLDLYFYRLKSCHCLTTQKYLLLSCLNLTKFSLIFKPKLNAQCHPNPIKSRITAPPAWYVRPSQPVSLGLSHYYTMLQNGLKLNLFLATLSPVKGSCQSQCYLKNGWGREGAENRLLRDAILHSVPIGQGAINAPLSSSI